jgi:hypothetical protein
MNAQILWIEMTLETTVYAAIVWYYYQRNSTGAYELNVFVDNRSRVVEVLDQTDTAYYVKAPGFKGVRKDVFATEIRRDAKPLKQVLSCG